MKFIGYNIIPVCLIGLAGYMMHFDKPYWGWVIVVACLLAVYPSSTKV